MMDSWRRPQLVGAARALADAAKEGYIVGAAHISFPGVGAYRKIGEGVQLVAAALYDCRSGAEVTPDRSTQGKDRATIRAVGSCASDLTCGCGSRADARHSAAGQIGEPVVRRGIRPAMPW